MAENLDAFDGVWVLHTVFHFAGAMHDYLAEAGRSPMSREEVEHRLNLYGARIRLFERFLREVKLEIMQ